jgi:hypothetical protein
MKFLEKGMSIIAVGRHYYVNESTIISSRKMNKRSGEALRPMVYRLRKFLLSVIVPVPRKYGNILVSMVEKCHTGLSEVLWSCRRPCCYTQSIAHAESKEKKSFLASNEYYEIVKKQMSLHDEKRTGDSASANLVAATKYLEHLRKIIDGRDNLPQQDVHPDGTSHFWKKDYRLHLYPRTKRFLQELKFSSVIALLGIL